MELSREDIITILNTVQVSGYRYFNLEVGDLKVTMGGSAPAEPVAETRPMPAASLHSGPTDHSEAPTAAPAPAETEAGNTEKPDLNRHVLTAPVVGVFYSSPSPDEPPYVSVGDHVEEGETVGLIEVMKVYNSVASDVTGTVVEVLVENNEAVEYGQPLLVIAPLNT